MHAWRANVVAFTLIACAALTVNRLRPPLNAAFSSTKAVNDVYALPPPGQLTVMSIGYRSALAADMLQKMGYINVWSMDGGWKAWKDAGAPIE